MHVYVPSEYVTPTPRIPVTSRSRAVAAGKGTGYYYDTVLQGEDTRVYTMPSSIFPPVAIQVVGQLSGVDNELARIRLWLFLVSIGGIALASGAGLLVAQATLRPLRNLSETAERVRATRDLSQRIEVEGSDELGTLAATFNAMLESLDQAAERQRQLVQDASHELRTPLTSLRTNIEVLAADEHMPPAEREQLLRDVVAQLGEMTELIGELTELARGAEQDAPARGGPARPADRGRDPAHGAQPPRDPDRGVARADQHRRPAGQPRTRDREPARQRGEVEPRRLAGRGPARRTAS